MTQHQSDCTRPTFLEEAKLFLGFLLVSSPDTTGTGVSSHSRSLGLSQECIDALVQCLYRLPVC